MFTSTAFSGAMGKRVQNFPVCRLFVFFLALLAGWCIPDFAHAQPLVCSQCNSGDVKFNRIYVGSPSGVPLSNTCTVGATVSANLCVEFEVVSNTRYGFYLAVQYTVNSIPYSFTQCYSETLNQGVFKKCLPITYRCGDQVMMKTVLMAWGNQQKDLNSFCLPNNLTCSDFNPKCFSEAVPAVEAPLIGNFTNAPSCQGTNPFQTIAYSGTATGGTGPYTYDWDLDGNGTFETLNQPTPTRLYTISTSVSVTMRVTDRGNPVKTDLQTYSIVPGACVVLPVTLTRFEVSEKDRKAELTWETTQEKDNAYFLVEYSLDGKSFEALGRVEGHNTAESAHHYSFVHETPPVGITYYRLRQTDLNGQFAYSKIKSVIIRANGKVAIHQNPVGELLSLSGLENGATVQVINLKGLALYQTVAETGQLKVPVPQSWVNGLYLLRVIDQYGRQTFRFLIER